MNRIRRLFQLSALSAATAFGGAALLAAPTVASAAAPQVRTQAPGFDRTMLGDFEITALSDGTVDLDVAKLLAEPAAKTDAALARAFVHGPLETSVNAYLVNTGTKLVLVDAGAGTLFGPTLGKLLASLQAALGDHPLVGEVRGTGLIGGIELVADKARRKAFPSERGVGMTCRNHCFETGLVMRAVRDTMVFAPPFTITDAEIAEFTQLAVRAIDLTWRDVEQEPG